MAQRTSLYNEHLRLGGKMIEFAGWQLPLQFQGLRPEHHSVRHNIGLFDVSHMGELRVQGPQALETLNYVLGSPVQQLEKGQAHYSLMLNEQGGVVDDLIVYCLEKNQNYLLCVNAINTQKNFEWILKHNKGAEVIDESLQWAQIAIQGPKALELVERVHPTAAQLKVFELCANEGFLWARTGYTGEKGVEVFVPWAQAPEVWQNLLSVGREFGVAPIGLAARDTLRIEMCYSLYGHEIDEHTMPADAGLSWVLRNKEGDFLGRSALGAGAAVEARAGARAGQGSAVGSTTVRGQEPAAAQGRRKLVAFRVEGPRVPRQNYGVFSIDKQPVGKVTSGTYSPVLGVGVGMAYVGADWAHVDSKIYIDFRGRMLEARVVKKPFVAARIG